MHNTDDAFAELVKEQNLRETILHLRPTLAGRILYHLLPFRRRVVRQNIQRVFSPYLDARAQQRLAKAFYSHIAKLCRENLLLRLLSKKRAASRVTIDGLEHLIAWQQRQQGGAILLTAHLGNWEFAPIAALTHLTAFRDRLHAVRKAQRIAWLERILFKRFRRAGIHIIPARHGLQQICDALEKGDGVLFTFDQHASPKRKDGIVASFMGLPAGTYKSVAMLAKRLQVPVFPVACYRLADGRHQLSIQPALPWYHDADTKRELALNTQAYNHALERLILQHPDQWLWMYKRWKV